MKPLLAALLLVLVAGCGGSEKPDAATTKSPTSPTPAVTTSTAPTAPAADLLNRAELADVLLTLNDVPPGFTQDPDDDTGDGKKTFCDYKVPFRHKLSVARGFSDDAGQRYLSTIIRQYASVEQAKASFDALVKALQACKKDESDGETYDIALMSAPKLGDGSVGVQLTASSYVIKNNFVLVGPVLVTTGAVGLEAPLIASSLATQVERYGASVR